jgi:hypothetical protein
MTKKSNRIINITSVLLALLVLGLTAGTASADDILKIYNTSNLTAAEVAESSRIGTDKINETYVNHKVGINITVQLDATKLSSGELINGTGYASGRNMSVTNVTITFPSGVILPTTIANTSMESAAFPGMYIENAARTGFNLTNTYAAMDATNNLVIFSRRTGAATNLSINDTSGEGLNFLHVNITNVIMPSSVTGNNLSINVSAFNVTAGVGTNITAVFIRVNPDSTAPTASASFAAYLSSADSSATVTDGLDSDNKVINLAAYSTNIPPINFTVNDTGTSGFNGSGINFTRIQVILDMGTSSQQYLMQNGTTTLNTNAIEYNTRNGSIRLRPALNGSLGNLIAGNQAGGTSHTLTVSVGDNSTNPATNYTKTFYVNRIILGANKTTNIVANGSDAINLTAHLLNPNGSTDIATPTTILWSGDGGVLFGPSGLSSVATVNGNGNSSIGARFNTAGVHTITANFNQTTNTIKITTTAAVAGVTLTGIGGGCTTTTSCSIVANGTDNATLRAQLVDSSGSTVLKSGYTVNIGETTSGYGATPASAATDTSGRTNFTVTSNTTIGASLSYYVTITLDNSSLSNSNTVAVSFISGPVRTLSVNTTANGSAGAATSFVGLGTNSPGTNASIDSLVAGNTTVISVNLTDDGTHPVSGATVNFALSGTGSLSATSATTNSTGTAVVTFTSGTTAGNLTGLINVTTTNNVTLNTFVRVNTTNGSANKIVLTANRTGLATGTGAMLNASIQDANGNAVNVSGVNVTFTIISGSSLGTIDNNYSLTDPLGTARVNFTAGSSAGTVVVEANSTTMILPGSTGNKTNITLIIGTADGLTLSLNKTNMPTTDGPRNGAPIIATAQLTSGGASLGASGVNITFLITNGTVHNNNATFTPNASSITVQTNSSGTAQVLVNGSGRVETVNLTAADTDNPAISTQVATITFTGSATTFTLANGTIALPDSLGRRNTTVTVQLKDSAGNNVGSANGVTFTVSGGTLSASSGTTNSSTGQLNVTLSGNTSSGAATPQVTAYISGMSPTSVSLTVSMPQPTLAVARNVSTVTVNTPTPVLFTVTSDSTKVSGATVTLSGAGVTNSSTTDATGNVTFSVNATSAGTVTASASSTGYAGGSTTITATTTVGAVLTTITVSPSNPTVASGSTQTFTAVGKDQNGTNITISPAAVWSSSNATVGTINSNTGVFAASKVGTATITATNGTNGTVSGNTTVTVTAGSLAAITVLPSAPTLLVGATQTFTAAGADAAGNAVSITPAWSSSNTTVGTINSTTGVFTAVAAGTALVNATAQNITGSATVTVVTVIVNGAIAGTVTNGSSGLPLQGATVTAANATFSMSTTTNATGYYTITNLYPGTYTVTASLTGYNPSSASVTVASGATTPRDFPLTPAVGPTPQNITIAPTSETMTVNQTQQFIATLRYSDGNTQNITATATWSSSSPSVASFIAGSSTLKASGNGTTQVTASYQGITSTPAPVLSNPNGDVTANGVVDSIDVMFLAQSVAGTRSSSSLPNHEAGDVALPGGPEVDSIDVMFLAQYVAGTRPSLTNANPSPIYPG